MHRFARLALAASLMALPAAGAEAAPFLNMGGSSWAFGDGNVGCAAGADLPCDFNYTFTFNSPVGFAFARVDISSIAGSDEETEPSNLDFRTVTLNGVGLDLDPNGRREYGNLMAGALTATDNRLTVTGRTFGQAAYAGTLSFRADAPVPEPSTWLMMIVGFGAVGYSLRRRTALQARQAV